MKLTDKELEIMKLGNPPGLGPSDRRNLDQYTSEEKDKFALLYTTRKHGYKRLAAELGWHELAARKLLWERGILRTRRKISDETYQILINHIQDGKSSAQIALETGWDRKRVRRMRENLRKQHYIHSRT